MNFANFNPESVVFRRIIKTREPSGKEKEYEPDWKILFNSLPDPKGGKGKSEGRVGFHFPTELLIPSGRNTFQFQILTWTIVLYKKGILIQSLRNGSFFLPSPPLGRFIL